MQGTIFFIFGLCAALALENPNEDPNLFEGDMVLTPEQKKELEDTGMNPNIPLAATKTNLWPKTIPWDMESSISRQSRAVAVIHAAIADYEKHTCLRFKRRTTETGGYISFYRGGGCSSYVGYSRHRVNRISLAGGCWYKGIVIHEIAHSLGFFHEQSRPDRDNHVQIIWENIQGGMDYNFKKQRSDNIDSLNVAYDYKSVMHYGKTAFGNGRVTIKTINPAMQDVIGQRAGFSGLDIKQMNLLYKCSGVTPKPTTQAPNCQDLSNQCSSLKAYCNDVVLRDCVRKSCPLSCGVCTTATTTVPRTTRPPTDCKDKTSNCDRYTKYCSKPAGDSWGDWLRKYCRKTCNYCGGGQVTTMAPQTTSPSNCKDKTSNCDRYTKYCSRPAGDSWGDWLRKYCRKTCNYCGGGQVTTMAPQTTSPPNCNDVVSDCHRFTDKCNRPVGDGWGDYLRKYCKKTCGFCGSGGKTTKRPVTTRPSCKDLTTNCASYIKYCSRPAGDSWGDWLRKYCRKTCNYCGDGGKTTQLPFTTVGPTSPPGQCGTSQVQSGRVIAGTNAKQGYWPWQILMFYGGRTSCGGSLIAPNWVVTAAHCVSRRENQAYSFKIRVGEHYSGSKDGNEDDIQVSKIISHPSYSRSTIDSDIALMKLSRPAKLGKYVNTVCLPGQGQHVPVGTECYITGWGKIQHPGSMHHTLQQAKIPVVSYQECTKLNTKNLGIKITKNMVCAGHGGSTRVSGCHGDSGGPFVCKTGSNGRWELHGAVSWGSGRCDATASYTVFARVAEFRSWIDQTMHSN